MSNVSDPIADFLTRVRNAARVGKAEIVAPSSKILAEIARILKEEGFINDYSVHTESGRNSLKLQLRFVGTRSVITDLKRVSRPGLRKYVGALEVPRVLSGMGISILSTSSGVMSSREAKRRNVGGELLAFVW
ncbi:MAG: 30S ribosomal protein S8 [Verrucomicrobiota bacterium]